MTFESQLLSCKDYNSLYNHLDNAGILQLTLERNFGWEKIKMLNAEEYFNLERVTLHIDALSRRENLSESEIDEGKQICLVFRGLWEQLDEQLKTLNCTAALFYKMVHYPSSAFYSDSNPSWIDFWSKRTVLLKRSWGIFSAEERLFRNSKLN